MTDEETLAEFVIWRLRTSHLPRDVKDAAMRLAETGRFPRPGVVPGYVQVPLRVTGFPDADPLLTFACAHDEVAEAVGDALEAGSRYVLIDRLD